MLHLEVGLLCCIIILNFVRYQLEFNLHLVDAHMTKSIFFFQIIHIIYGMQSYDPWRIYCESNSHFGLI